MNKRFLRAAALPFIISGSLLFASCGLGAAPVVQSSEPVAATSTGTAPVQETEPASQPLPAAQTSGPVVVDARVIPLKIVSLSFEERGAIAEILVREGERVAAGAPLIRLDNRVAMLRVEDAETRLAEVKADYERLVERATPEEIAQAEATIARTQAELRRTRALVTAQDVAAAQSELAAARATLARLQAGPRAELVRGAETELEEARINLEIQRDALSAAKTRAQLRMEQIANTLRDLQDVYSRIRWRNDQMRQSQIELDQADIDAEAAALRAVENAEKSVDEARLNYDAARQAEIDGIALAETRIRRAEAVLDHARRGADQDEVALAQARITRATATLTQLQGEQRAANIEAATANVEIAQAALERMLADPSTSELAAAQARIQRAEVTLKQTRLSLEMMTLYAPIAGTVTEVTAVVGVPDTGMPVITLADMSGWQIETRDISELSIARVREGDPVRITFYAIPGLELTGRVVLIRALGNNDARLGTSYSALIIPDTLDERLRWNMTASVTILPGQ